MPTSQAQAFSTYLSARFAAGEHDMAEAARYYGQSLQDDPGNADLLAHAFFYSTTAGDFEAAGEYAQAVVAATPDDRAARLALAVVAFKHKDYADARKNLSLSAKGPFTVLTLSLFDAWAAAAPARHRRRADGHEDPGRRRSGAEGLAAFHAALMADYLGQDAMPMPPTRRRWRSSARSPRVVEAYGRFLERKGRTADASKLYTGPYRRSRRLPPSRSAGWRASPPAKSPNALIRNAEDGAAEALFGIAARSPTSPAPMSRSSICAWRFICAPIWRWPRSCWPTASRRCANTTRRSRSIAHRQSLALFPHGGGAGGAGRSSGWTRMTTPSPI